MLLLFMFYNYSAIGFDGLLFFGAFVFIGIYGYTTLMDRGKSAVWIEPVRGVGGLVLIWVTGDWFGLNALLPFGSFIVALYFIATIIGAHYFTFIDRPLKHLTLS